MVSLEELAGKIDKVKNLLDNLSVPDGMSIIIRTAGIDRQIEELNWDIEYLKKLWVEVEGAISKSKATPTYLRRSDESKKTIRDYFKEDIGELVVDNQEDFDDAKTYATKIVPEFVEKIKLMKKRFHYLQVMELNQKSNLLFQERLNCHLAAHWLSTVEKH